MRIPKIYLETTIFNFVFADDAPDKKEATIKLFEEIANGKYEAYTSYYVVEELEKAFEPKRSNMLELIKQYNVSILEVSPEAERLADIYGKNGIIPEKYHTDGILIAVATVNNMNYIISLNFKHIVKVKTIETTKAINILEGYREISIYSPMEVIDYDEN